MPPPVSLAKPALVVQSPSNFQTSADTRVNAKASIACRGAPPAAKVSPPAAAAHMPGPVSKVAAHIAIWISDLIIDDLKIALTARSTARKTLEKKFPIAL